MQDRPRQAIGIDASAELCETRAQVAKIARATAELIGLGRDLREDEISVLPGWAGDYHRPVRPLGGQPALNAYSALFR